MIAEESKRIKVLISAYACEPDKGSEPEVGWQWVNHLAEHCEVHVLTRKNNREGIAKFYKEKEPKLTYHYHDLSTYMMKFKKLFLKGNLGVSIYASLWHRSAARICNSIIKDEEIDIFHHLTIASYRIPFARLAPDLDVKVIVGPVGGCEDFPSRLLPDKAKKVRVKEWIRNKVLMLTTRYHYFFKRYKEATLILASTKEMFSCFSHHGFERCKLFPTIGVNLPQNVKVVSESRDLKLLFVGNILYWKGLGLAIRALAKLPKKINLTCYGHGGDQLPLESLSKDLGVSDRVHFMGKVPRNELLQLYFDYDVFLYPSLHDSGSFTVLEAMASGLPTVCLNRGGPGVSVLEDCGFSVDANGTKEEVVNRLVDAVMSYVKNRDLLKQHSEASVRRIREDYEWSVKAKRMFSYYEELVKQDK